MNQEMVPVDIMLSTASTQMTHGKDSSKSLLTAHQKTAATGTEVTSPIEDSQMNTIYDNQLAALTEGPVVSLSGYQSSFEDCSFISEGNQASDWGQVVTSNANQTYHGHHQMSFNSEQKVHRNQVTTAIGDQTVYRNQVKTYNDQNVYRDKVKILSANQPYYNNQMTVPNGNQTLYGGQPFPFDTNQTLYSGQPMPHDPNHTFSGVQTMPFDNNQTLFGGQTIPWDSIHVLSRSQNTTATDETTFYRNQAAPSDGNPILCGDQTISHFGDQPFFKGQPMNASSHYDGAQITGFQTLCGSQKRTPSDDHQNFYRYSMTSTEGNPTFDGGQTTTPNGDQTCNTRWMMSLVSSQMPHEDTVLDFSISHMVQGQTSACSSDFPVVPGNLPPRKNGLKTPTQNTGKAYVCKYCGHSFSKSSHLTGHIRKHTGE